MPKGEHLNTKTYLNRFGLSLILLTSLFCSKNAFAAFDFSPIIATFAPSGQGATVSFTVTNSDSVKIPVQVSIVPREPNIKGEETYKESEKMDEMFRIFPNQLVLNPKESRTIRVTWIGSPKTKVEIPFRIIAEELPVDVDDPNKVYTKAVAKIGLATRYIGSLYVTPNGVKPEVIVEAKKAEGTSQDLVIDITNKGGAHQVLKQPVVKLQSISGGKEVVLTSEEVSKFVNQNILPGRQRRFTMAWPKNLPPGPVKVKLELAKE